MYYQNYEDYMRSVLNYPNTTTYNNMNDYYTMPNLPENNYSQPSLRSADKLVDKLAELYPENYKLINPIVEKMCRENLGEITNEKIEKMVDEIYAIVEDTPDNVVNINVAVSKNIEDSNKRTERTTASSRRPEVVKEERETRRRPNVNQTLRDLIRILILNSIINNQRPPRPPMPPPPPIRPPVRPPIRPRDYDNNDYFKF